MFGQVRPRVPRSSRGGWHWGKPGDWGGFQRLVGVGRRVAGTEFSEEALGVGAKISYLNPGVGGSRGLGMGCILPWRPGPASGPLAFHSSWGMGLLCCIVAGRVLASRGVGPVLIWSLTDAECDFLGRSGQVAMRTMKCFCLLFS